MGVLERVGLIFKTRLGSRKGFLTNLLLNSQRLGIRGCLTLSLKREETLVHQQRIQLVEGVSRSIKVIMLREQIIVLVVVKMGTSLGIALM